MTEPVAKPQKTDAWKGLLVVCLFIATCSVLVGRKDQAPAKRLEDVTPAAYAADGRRVPPIAIDPTKTRWKQTEAQARRYLPTCDFANTDTQVECLNTELHFVDRFVAAMAGDFFAQTAIAGFFMVPETGTPNPGTPTNPLEACAWFTFLGRGSTDPGIQFTTAIQCERLTLLGKADAQASAAAIAKAVNPANKPPAGWHATTYPRPD